MDNIKDINVQKVLDIKSSKTNPFGQNMSAERLYRKGERLVAAVHLLTAHIPPHEASRMKIRASGTDLLPQLLALRDVMRAPLSPEYKMVLTTIRHMNSLVRVLCASGFISTQNAEIVNEALDDMASFLHAAQRSDLSESVGVDFSDDMSSKESEIEKRHVRISNENRPVREEGVSDKGQNSKTDTRSERILSFMKRGELMSIKDIVSRLPEYSEKMVQRQLMVLVLEGRVIKTGNKRWSRYSLI